MNSQNTTFKALLLTKADDGSTQCAVTQLDESQLPEGEVLIDVRYSTVNYKDGLAISGKSPVVRKFPMVPGIDFAGTVASSRDSRFKPGDAVILNGWGVGEGHWGGLSGKASVKADWLVPLPEGMTAQQAMAIGTAGYTAMLCVMALEKHGVKPEDGEILVTGASGGVGSVAVSLLSELGYTVTASTGRLAESPYLMSLGATSVIDRNELSAPGKPLAKERWAGVVDSVGSHTLANACAASKYGGAVAACGLAGGMDFPASVAPFILRAVTLYGIDSVMAPQALRSHAWSRLATDLDISKLDALTTQIELDDAIDTARQLLEGKIRGRVVVQIGQTPE